MRRGRFFVGEAQATGAADDDDDDEDAACSAGAALAACFIRAERGGGSDGESFFKRGRYGIGKLFTQAHKSKIR